jgi:hypothetical protein
MSNFINDIPKNVKMGPMWQLLPYELVILIIKLLFLTHPWSKPGLIVDMNRFDFVNRYRKTIEFRSFAAYACSVPVLEFFYSGNDFVFKFKEHYAPLGPYGTSIPPAFPPIRARPFLRRMQVHLTFEDCYHSFLDGAHHWIQSVDDFFKYCPAARTLRNLTQARTGFCNLDRLDLQLLIDFDYARVAMRVFRKAEFTVRARAVAITMEDPSPLPRAQGTEYLARLIDLINVVH